MTYSEESDPVYWPIHNTAFSAWEELNFYNNHSLTCTVSSAIYNNKNRTRDPFWFLRHKILADSILGNSPYNYSKVWEQTSAPASILTMTRLSTAVESTKVLSQQRVNCWSDQETHVLMLMLSLAWLHMYYEYEYKYKMHTKVGTNSPVRCNHPSFPFPLTWAYSLFYTIHVQYT
jgi:hypothetical protein